MRNLENAHICESDLKYPFVMSRTYAQNGLDSTFNQHVKLLNNNLDVADNIWTILNLLSTVNIFIVNICNVIYHIGNLDQKLCLPNLRLGEPTRRSCACAFRRRKVNPKWQTILLKLTIFNDISLTSEIF